MQRAMLVMAGGIVVTLLGGGIGHAQQQQRPVTSSARSSVPQLVSAYQVCKLREVELVQQNNVILQRSALLANEKNIDRMREIAGEIGSARTALLETEASWQRMSCAGVMYGERSMSGR